MKKLLSIALLSVALFGAPRVGDAQVAFNLPTLYNASTNLSSEALHGKVVLLNLWASWCSGCQEEMPLFVQLQKKYAKKNFEIVLASIDSLPQSAQDFLAQVDRGRSLTAIYDAQKVLPRSYKCPGMPSSFLIGKDGKIVAVYVGSLDVDGIHKLQSKIHTLLGE